LSDPFYSGGLRFACTRCSSCCRGGPGYVFLTKNDLSSLLSRLSLDFKSFFARYCRLVEIETGRFAISLREKPGYDCIFWEGEGCSVYEQRPVQCSTFPFWATILDSQEAWKDAARDCPGMDRGELCSRDHIEECLWRRRAEPLITLDRDAARHPERLDENSVLGS
jgi:Fe-S-cluster containining protein